LALFLPSIPCLSGATRVTAIRERPAYHIGVHGTPLISPKDAELAHHTFAECLYQTMWYLAVAGHLRGTRLALALVNSSFTRLVLEEDRTMSVETHPWVVVALSRQECTPGHVTSARAPFRALLFP
jgi:hypothetical protein